MGADSYFSVGCGRGFFLTRVRLEGAWLLGGNHTSKQAAHKKPATDCSTKTKRILRGAGCRDSNSVFLGLSHFPVLLSAGKFTVMIGWSCLTKLGLGRALSPRGERVDRHTSTACCSWWLAALLVMDDPPESSPAPATAPVLASADSVQPASQPAAAANTNSNRHNTARRAQLAVSLTTEHVQPRRSHADTLPAMPPSDEAARLRTDQEARDRALARSLQARELHVFNNETPPASPPQSRRPRRTSSARVAVSPAASLGRRLSSTRSSVSPVSGVTPIVIDPWASPALARALRANMVPVARLAPPHDPEDGTPPPIVVAGVPICVRGASQGTVTVRRTPSGGAGAGAGAGASGSSIRITFRDTDDGIHANLGQLGPLDALGGARITIRPSRAHNVARKTLEMVRCCT